MVLMPIGEAELGLEAPSATPAMTRAAPGALRSMLGRIADFLLPPVCISCRTRIGSHGLLCGACFAKIDFIAPPLCARLGIPLPFEAGEPLLSAAAIASPPVYDRARAAAHYSDTMRELIQSFKYRDRHEGLHLFARWLKKAGAGLLADADLIVPVPLYPSRLWWRRFNQSAMLALTLSRLSGVPVDCFVLKRVRRTASQVGLSADQRRRNVAGAFRVEKGREAEVKGRKLVVVDDVITTGATAEACARVLKRSGAARVDILALARVVEPAAFVL
jgi:ComF family protein